MDSRTLRQVAHKSSVECCRWTMHTTRVAPYKLAVQRDWSHGRVCGLGSGAGGHLGAVTQTDPCFRLTCKLKAIRAYLMGKKEKKKGNGEKPL